jgi:predicted NUDIX family phosphoesterase
MTTAVCINKADLLPDGIPDGKQDLYLSDFRKLLSCKATLEERVNCEKDPTKLQIIPYITLFDKTTKDVFIYTRGKASGEQRLAGNCSIGLGGHMETDPFNWPQDEDAFVKNEDTVLAQVIVEEALRELEEEIGIEPTDELRAAIKAKIASGNFGLMYNVRTEVDQLHLAVAFFIGVDKDEIMSRTHEANVITRGQWMPVADIQRSVTAGVFQIEHWTRMVLESIQYAWKG